VTSLLSYNRLTGTLSPGFGPAWPALEELLLNGNGFTGPLPASWGSFKSLKTLCLASNRLQGSVPTSWGALAATPLKSLCLSSNPGLVGCLLQGLDRIVGGKAFCGNTGLTCSTC
jgi:hypothetical protein